MHTVTAKIPNELFVRLENLAKISERKKSYLIKKAVENFLDDKEDYYIALKRLESKEINYSLEELEK